MVGTTGLTDTRFEYILTPFAFAARIFILPFPASLAELSALHSLISFSFS